MCWVGFDLKKHESEKRSRCWQTLSQNFFEIKFWCFHISGSPDFLSDEDEEISNWDVNGSGLAGQNGAPEIQGNLYLFSVGLIYEDIDWLSCEMIVHTFSVLR